MNEKHSEVRTWLECKFAGETIPAYEINSETVDQLYELMKKNIERDKDIQLVIEEMRQAAVEYKAEAERERKILEQVGLTAGDLSKSGVTSLKTLVSVANALKIRDTTDTNYMLAMRELSDEQFRVSETRRAEQSLAHQLGEKSKVAKSKSQELQRTLATLDEYADQQADSVKSNSKDAGFLQKKAENYHKDIKKATAQLKKFGLEPPLYHSELVKKAAEIQELEDKLQPLRTKLKTYHSLPPDLSLARLKIEELQKDLDLLEAQVQEKMNVMHS